MTPEGYKKHKKLIEAWANGAIIEYSDSGKHWIPASHNDDISWRDWINYRIKPATPDTINWDHVHPDFNYMARDENGTVCLFSKLPNNKSGIWCAGIDGGRYSIVRTFNSYKQGTVDWKDSLVCRHDSQS